MFARYRKRFATKERAIRGSADSLIREANCTLSGSLVFSPPFYRYGTGLTFLNCLAHADWDTLCVVANEVKLGEGRAWDSALIFLAAELLATAQSPEELLRIQRAELVPLELDVLKGTAPRPTTPAKLVDSVRPRVSRAMAARRGGSGVPPPP